MLPTNIVSPATFAGGRDLAMQQEIFRGSDTRRFTMSWTTDSSQIMTGDEVIGSDGDKVGTVAEVQPNYIVVEKGFFFPTDYYIPMSAISSVAGNQVVLNVAKDSALQSGWDTVPDVVPMGATDTEPLYTDVDVSRTSQTDRVAAA